jgi:hypothetical protein
MGQEKPTVSTKTIDVEIPNAMWKKRNSYLFREVKQLPENHSRRAKKSMKLNIKA